jgi:hexosaminidase
MRLLLFFALLFNINLVAQPLIPKPISYIKATDTLDMSTIRFIFIQDSSSYNDAVYLKNLFSDNKMDIVLINEKIKIPKIENCIFLKNDMQHIPKGYYEMTVFKNHIFINGLKDGVFYGIETLRQLAFHGKNNIACCAIIDYPAYTWRGMHLDCVRHFFPTSFIKKYIDMLAMHKMNIFHWHLTDDQGWRIEIKKYPLLTSIGSKRKETIIEKNFDPYKGDGIPYEGFYTQNEIKEIVDYASKRHVTIVPEIEMPGHALGALAAYPQYSCNKKPLDVLTKWGVSDDVFCVNDSTFQFLQNILDEVMELFPSKYIHIGGDEVPKTRWKTCANCQRMIKENKLKDEHELQSYFIKKIDAYVTSKGKNIIGWDEILEGGLAPNAAVMSWRGEEGGIEAAKQKHQVVMTPGSHCYFDHYQGNKNTEPLAIGGYTSLEKVYSYNPTPEALTNEEKKYILGAQGNVWTEYMATEKQVEYMAMPRLCALSEVLWTKPYSRNYKDFTARLLYHLELLKKQNIHYANSMWDVQAESKASENGILVTLKNDMLNSNNQGIFYTTDDSRPSNKSILYKSPILIQKNTMLNAAVLDHLSNPTGSVFSQEYFINKATGKPITTKPAPSNSYNRGGDLTLVNGIVGSLPWSGNEWLGWQTNMIDVELDLMNVTTVQNIKVKYLADDASWIHLPVKIELWCSYDGKEFVKKGTLNKLDIETMYKNNMPQFVLKPSSMRFVKLHIESNEKIPAGKAGAGETPWLFISEIMIE